MAGPCNAKRCWISAGVTFAGLNILEFLWHGVILKDVYQRPHYMTLWNSQEAMKGRMWAMYAAYALVAALFSTIYTRGYEDGKPAAGQGARYGLMIGALVGGFHALMDYFVYPVSVKLAATWAAASVLNFVILGIVVALIYRPKST